MKNIEIILVGVIALLCFYWGCDYRHKASKYEGLYNKNEFIITYLIDNNQIELKDIKKANEEYENSQLGILQDDSPGGQGY